MSRKSNDAPLKLIQLVPSNGKEGPGQASSEAYDPGLRLQIGIEGEPSWGSRALEKLTRIITRYSPRMAVRQKQETDGGGTIRKPGRMANSFRTIMEILQVIFSRLGSKLEGFKQTLFSIWGRFRQEDDFEDLVQPRFDRAAPPELKVASQESKKAAPQERHDDVLAKEIKALREEFNAQQYELSRVNNFVVDLKSRVIAQQKMILSLAEELDAVAMDLSGDVRSGSNESEAVQRH